MEETGLIKLALEQVPALTVVAIMLYVFLKAFERVIDKLTATQENIVKLSQEASEAMARNNIIMEKYQEGASDIKDASANLARITQMIEFSCNYPKNV